MEYALYWVTLGYMERIFVWHCPNFDIHTCVFGLIVGYMYRFWLYSMVYSSMIIPWICPIFMLFLLYINQNKGYWSLGNRYTLWTCPKLRCFWPIFDCILPIYHEFGLNIAVFTISFMIIPWICPIFMLYLIHISPN